MRNELLERVREAAIKGWSPQGPTELEVDRRKSPVAWDEMFSFSVGYIELLP